MLIPRPRRRIGRPRPQRPGPRYPHRPHCKYRVERLHELFGGDGHETRGRITIQQGAHIFDGLRRREHRQPLTQCPHSVHTSARSGDFAQRIV
ncbi:hypothetical protein EES39_39095 [Streptomyces sp. ADI92-24]|nr:hypothetical protein EES39_39095 [Streptomyces sp. ADI92-24]